MTPVRDPRRWYRGLPLGTRAHVALRWATGPFGRLEALLPPEGRILDWGCGHGVLAVWAASRGPGRRVLGVDIDAAKVAAAEAAAVAAGVSDRVELAVVGPTEVPTGSWDAVVLCDVLYLTDPALQPELAVAAARAVAPGGVLVCKEMGARPIAKAWLARAQELLTVRGLGITATEHGPGAFPDPEVVAGWLERVGLVVEVRRLDRGYHVPHVAVIGRRPASPTDGRLHA